MSDDVTEKYFIRDDEAEVDRRLTVRETQLILDRGRVGTPVLDIGIGHGVLIDAIIEKFGECSVVEKSGRLVQAARARHPKSLKAYESNVEKFEPVNQFQTIFATGILHHVEEPQEVLRRISGWLKPGGNIILSVPNGHSVHRAMGVALGIQESLLSQTQTGERSGVSHVFSPKSLGRLVDESGLSITQRIGSYVKVLSNAQMAQFSEEELDQLFQFGRTVPLDFHSTIILDCERATESNH